MKKNIYILTYFYFWIGIFSLQSQTAEIRGNEWIETDKTYLKIETDRDGICRLTPDRLPLSFSPENIRIYYRGKLQPVYIHNQGNLQAFDGEDYLEFFGKRLDAADEKELYRHPVTHLPGDHLQPNPFHGTMNDTSAYFITDGGSPLPDSLRITLQTLPVNEILNFPLRPFYRYKETRAPYWRTDPYSPGGYDRQYDVFRTGNCAYTTGEGYVFRQANSFQFFFDGKYPYSDARPAVSVYANGFFPASSTQNCTLSFNGQNRVFTLKGDLMNLCSAEFSSADLKTESNSLAFQAGLSSFLLTAGYVELQYNRLFSFDKDTLIPINFYDSTGTDTRIEVSGLNVKAVYYLYDWDLNTKTVGSEHEGKILFSVKGQIGNRNLTLTAEKRIEDHSSKIKIYSDSDIKNWTDYEGAEMIVITNPYVKASALEYAAYRDTCKANRLKTVVITTEELYDEFSYGSQNALALKRLMKIALNEWKIKPKYLFLWGKGFYAYLGGDNKTPTWGTPASDSRYVCDFRTDGIKDFVPEIPVGRLNVLNEQEGRNYLEKVKEYEHTPYAEWMKNAVHLGGGNGPGEQSGIVRNLTLTKNIFEAAPLGGKAYYFQKGPGIGAPPPPPGASVKGLMKEGVGVFCFYGHSSPGLFDVEVLQPGEYENEGKYPFFIANGCYAGDFNNNNYTLGERFLIEKRKGAIGWLSSSSYGYASQLSRYNQIFYEVAFRDSLGIPIGRIVKETVRRFLDGGKSQHDYVHAAQVNLQGDPSISLYHPKGPDLELSRADVNAFPQNPTPETSEIRVMLRLRNIGSAFQDSFQVSCRHRLPSGEVKNYLSEKLPPVLREEFAEINISLPTPNSGGTHRLEMMTDSENNVREFNEENNRLIVDFTVPSDRPKVIFPYPYMITDRQLIYLSAALPGSKTPTVSYIFEVDTLPDFNSTFKVVSPTVAGNAELVTWRLPFRLVSGTVYYWRVRTAAGTEWAVSSFQHRLNRTGWGQSHFGQWKENIPLSAGLNADSLRPDRWKFDPFSVKMTARTSTAVEFNLDGGSKGYTNINASYRTGGVFYSVIDGKSLESLTRTPEYDYLDFADYREITKLETVFQSLKPGDHIVLISNVPFTSYWKWDTLARKNAFASVGIRSEDLYGVRDYDGFIAIGTKGAPVGSAPLEINIQESAPVKTTFMSWDFVSRSVSGTLRSPRFGPAGYRWRMAQQSFITDNPNEKLTFRLIGEDVKGKETLLRTFTQSEMNLDSISAETYPYLRLEADFVDSLNRTPPHPGFWQIFYDNLPEGVMVNDSVENKRLILRSGEKVTLSGIFHNVTPIGMNDLKIVFAAEDDKGKILFSETRAVGNLSEWGQGRFTFPFETVGLEGNVRLYMTVNPTGEVPEQNLANNTAQLFLTIISDRRPPILEVSVEGKIPVDGMIVSPDPEINIRLRDENLLNPPNDSTAITVKFGEFGSTEGVKSQFYRTGDLKIAELHPDGLTVHFRPKDLPDGRYLLEVQGRDKNNNPAGPEPYQIHLEVRNSVSVSDLIVMPNPFNEEVYFEYVLAGKVLPQSFTVEIFDLTGRRIHTTDVTSGLRPGQNLTRLIWDGTDALGNHLTEGIYTFRATVVFPPSADAGVIQKTGKIVKVN